MMRLWPRTLGGQLILVMLLAVVISQAISLTIYRLERAHTVRNIMGEECLGRAVSAFRLAEVTAPDLRDQTLKTIETPLTRYWISSSHLSPEKWQNEARSRLLLPTAATGRQSSTMSMFLQERMLDHASSAAWHDFPSGSLLLRHPIQILDLNEWNGFGYSFQLSPDAWLNMVYSKPVSLMPNNLTPGYYTTLVITILIFASAAIFVARRVSRPLRKLAKAAEQFGRGEKLETLREEGPADIRMTIGAFNRMQTRLHRFLEDRTRLLAAVGHDLRTPITSLRLRTEFIADAEMREKFIATLDEMQEMAEAVLSFAKSESLAETTRTVEMNALLESLCDDLVELGWKVSFESNGRLPYACRPTALRRAIRNVIENAVRYGELAHVSLLHNSEGVEICVEDAGPGVAEEDLQKIFEPFVRLESSRNRQTGGVGLGLSIARSIFRSHGGEIKLSQGSKGLRVHLHLPEAGHAATVGPVALPVPKEAEIASRVG